MITRPVLYAEDDDNDVFFMTRAFRKLGAEQWLRVVTNGRSAKQYLAGEGSYADRDAHPMPSLVMLDVKMPDVTGLQVLDWTRGRPELAAIPIVLFSSSTHDADVEYCRAHGASGYFVKPSNSEDLARLMRPMLECVEASDVVRCLDIPGNRIAGDLGFGPRREGR